MKISDDMTKNGPAHKISTHLDDHDIVLHKSTKKEIIKLRKKETPWKLLPGLWGLLRRITAGRTVLFYGPPGTGKTLAAALLGNYLNREVYRIDLSMVISKYIGETEKNLASLFDKAESKNWILFFDEADALFGKRTRVSDAHDRYSNQQITLLIKKIRSYKGLIILSSNRKDNIDKILLDKIHAGIYFPLPS